MRRVLLTLVPAVVLGLCLYAVELPLYVEGPGTAKQVLPLIDIDGPPTYEPSGQYLLTTVLQARANVYEAVAGWLDPASEVVPEGDVLLPGQTEREYRQVSRSLMDQSKIAAVVASLKRLTDYPREHGPGVIVQDSIPGGPAWGKLFPGDLITHVDDEPIEGRAELGRVIQRAGTTDSLALDVEPVEGGEERTVHVRPYRPDDADRPLIGIYSVANFPFEVRISSGNIGGPSAGLMWALGVTDLLTADDLAGDRWVAGTGTVGLDGRVGPIGGVRLKVAAAEGAGADLFLVPRSNLAEARASAADIWLVPVSTVGDAVRYLREQP